MSCWHFFRLSKRKKCVYHFHHRPCRTKHPGAHNLLFPLHTYFFESFHSLVTHFLLPSILLPTKLYLYQGRKWKREEEKRQKTSSLPNQYLFFSNKIFIAKKKKRKAHHHRRSGIMEHVPFFKTSLSSKENFLVVCFWRGQIGRIKRDKDAFALPKKTSQMNCLSVWLFLKEDTNKSNCQAFHITQHCVISSHA